jgi:hypothetical protein
MRRLHGEKGNKLTLGDMYGSCARNNLPTSRRREVTERTGVSRGHSRRSLYRQL